MITLTESEFEHEIFGEHQARLLMKHDRLIMIWLNHNNKWEWKYVSE